MSNGKGILPTPKSAEKLQGKLGKPKEQQLRNFLTNEEMSDRRAKGLLYYCDDKYSPDHNFKHKKTQLFIKDYEELELS